jgi:hypothetical protein
VRGVLQLQSSTLLALAGLVFLHHTGDMPDRKQVCVVQRDRGDWRRDRIDDQDGELLLYGWIDDERAAAGCGRGYRRVAGTGLPDVLHYCNSGKLHISTMFAVQSTDQSGCSRTHDSTMQHSRWNGGVHKISTDELCLRACSRNMQVDYRRHTHTIPSSVQLLYLRLLSKSAVQQWMPSGYRGVGVGGVWPTGKHKSSVDIECISRSVQLVQRGWVMPIRIVFLRYASTM